MEIERKIKECLPILQGNNPNIHKILLAEMFAQA
jgi:hemoglobin-like flavoprotein